MSSQLSKKDKALFVDRVYDHVGIIYKVCKLYAAREDLEDLKQEIIYQLWKSYPSFRGDSGFQTWMYRVAINTALLGLRARKIKYTPLSGRERDIPDLTDINSVEEERVSLLYMHISTLNDLDKTIIFLYLERFSYEEIAEITGISLKNVSVRLVRIREKLRKLFNVQTKKK